VTSKDLFASAPETAPRRLASLVRAEWFFLDQAASRARRSEAILM
jgi:hypothetical protein